MDVIFLGTNGWYDSATGNTICILIESDDYYIALVHFDAQRYPTLEARKVAEVHAKKIFPNTVATRDDMNLHL